VRKAVIAAAVTGGAVAVRRRRPKKVAAVITAAEVPAQRVALTEIMKGDGELVLAEQDAQDARILALIDQL
jgi:hypothetical protein